MAICKDVNNITESKVCLTESTIKHAVNQAVSILYSHILLREKNDITGTRMARLDLSSLYLHNCGAIFEAHKMDEVWGPIIRPIIEYFAETNVSLDHEYAL